MKYGLFTIRDRVAEAGGFPFASKNQATAARAFREFLQKQSGLLDANDFELLQIGLWDEDKCEISAVDKMFKIECAIPPSCLHESQYEVERKKE